MAEPDREPPSDLVSFGPTVTDSRVFTVGLWSVETLLFALVLAGFTVLRGVSDSVTVLVACAAVVWLGAVTAIVLRGRLQSLPGVGRRVLGILGLLVFASWLVWFLVLATGGGLSLATEVGLDAVGLLVGSAALVGAYFARMFRWRRGAVGL